MPWVSHPQLPELLHLDGEGKEEVLNDGFSPLKYDSYQYTYCFWISIVISLKFYKSYMIIIVTYTCTITINM